MIDLASWLGSLGRLGFADIPAFFSDLITNDETDNEYYKPDRPQDAENPGPRDREIPDVIKISFSDMGADYRGAAILSTGVNRCHNQTDPLPLLESGSVHC